MSEDVHAKVVDKRTPREESGVVDFIPSEVELFESLGTWQVITSDFVYLCQRRGSTMLLQVLTYLLSRRWRDYRKPIYTWGVCGGLQEEVSQ